MCIAYEKLNIKLIYFSTSRLSVKKVTIKRQMQYIRVTIILGQS